MGCRVGSLGFSSVISAITNPIGSSFLFVVAERSESGARLVRVACTPLFSVSFFFDDVESSDVHIAFGVQGHCKVGTCSAILFRCERFRQFSLCRSDR
jgi:hypothetical protein